MKALIDYFLYHFVRAFGVFVRRLPISAALWIGRMIGTLGYCVSIKHKSVAYANIKIAFAANKKPSEIKRIVKNLFQNYGQNLIELLRLPLLKPSAQKYIRFEGEQHIHGALKQGKGLILLAMHFGSWELTSAVGKMLHFPYRLFANPQKRFSKLDELLNSYRMAAGADVITRGRGTREFIETLRRNEAVGMVVDQGGRDGVLVKFFGRLASMSVGAIRIALKYDVPICFAVIHREKGPFHKIIVTPPLTLKKTGDVENDILVNLEMIVKIMEEYIQQYPAEYMWFYKIWKYSKEAKTIILSDGKAGHLRQSEAVAAVLDKALSERGIVSSTEIIPIQFRSRTASFLAVVCCLLSRPFSIPGRMRYLKWFLARESFLKMAHVKADYVISCGSSLAPINFFAASDYRAKNISVLTPGILGFRRFNLVILPRHDVGGKENLNGRAAVTEGALNLIDEKYLKDQAGALLEEFPRLQGSSHLKIGVLLGGETKNYTFTEAQAKKLAEALKISAKELNALLLITTSRRTPVLIEKLLKAEFEKDLHCPVLVLANERNIPEAVGGILGLSDIVVVSGESISMVSEAASSGKKVLVFPLMKKEGARNKEAKHDRFIEGLRAQGYIVLAAVDELPGHIAQAAEQQGPLKVLKDREKILENIRTII